MVLPLPGRCAFRLRVVPRAPIASTQYEDEYEDELGWTEDRFYRDGQLPALPDHEEGTATYGLGDEGGDNEGDDHSN